MPIHIPQMDDSFIPAYSIAHSDTNCKFLSTVYCKTTIHFPLVNIDVCYGMRSRV